MKERICFCVCSPAPWRTKQNVKSCCKRIQIRSCSPHDHINTRTITEVVTDQAGKHSCSNEWPAGASTRNCWKALLTRKRNLKGGMFISLAGVKEQDLSYKTHENPRWNWQWSNKTFPTRWGGDKHSWENGPRSSIRSLEESSKLQHPIPMSRYQVHPRLWNTWPTASHLVDGELKDVKSMSSSFFLWEEQEQNHLPVPCLLGIAKCRHRRREKSAVLNLPQVKWVE